MKCYAESSAVLRWLLGATAADEVRATLAAADLVVSSALTATEVNRTLRRLVAAGDFDAKDREAAWLSFSSAVAHWHIFAVTHAILSRAGESFPVDTLRTLDAIHVATAAQFSAEVEQLVVVSVDTRVRDNAVGLGLEVAP